jgi:hypothetical protein
MRARIGSSLRPQFFSTEAKQRKNPPWEKRYKLTMSTLNYIFVPQPLVWHLMNPNAPVHRTAHGRMQIYITHAIGMQYKYCTIRYDYVGQNLHSRASIEKLKILHLQEGQKDFYFWYQTAYICFLFDFNQHENSTWNKYNFLKMSALNEGCSLAISVYSIIVRQYLHW